MVRENSRSKIVAKFYFEYRIKSNSCYFVFRVEFLCSTNKLNNISTCKCFQRHMGSISVHPVSPIKPREKLVIQTNWPIVRKTRNLFVITFTFSESFSTRIGHFIQSLILCSGVSLGIKLYKYLRMIK